MEHSCRARRGHPAHPESLALAAGGARGGHRRRRHGAGAAPVGAWPRSLPVQRAGHHRLPHPGLRRLRRAGGLRPQAAAAVVTDTQVALYLEEHNPTLEAAILSAVETSTAGEDAAHSPRLVEKLVEQAIAQCRAVEHGHGHRSRPPAPPRGVARRIAAVAAAAHRPRPGVSAPRSVGPAHLHEQPRPRRPYSIEVTPGNKTVPRGGDQSVTREADGLQLEGRHADDAERIGQRLRAGPARGDDRPGGVRRDDVPPRQADASTTSRPTACDRDTFTLTSSTCRRSSQLELEYHFPAYTGLPPQKVDNGGDVAALRGTEVVQLKVTPTMKTAGGEILLNDGASAPLTVQADGTLTGNFTCRTPGFYRIELTARTARRSTRRRSTRSTS